MFQTKNTIPLDVRERMTGLLNQTLANLLDLISQYRFAHWNVRGRHFYPNHKLFEEVADSLEEHLDPIAERLTALGGVAEGTVKRAASRSSIKDFPNDTFEGDKVLVALIETTAQFGGVVRSGIDEADAAGDKGTADFLTALAQDADKGLWLLESQVRP